VSIPMAHVMRFKQRHTREENVVELVVEPVCRWAPELAPASRIPPNRVEGLKGLPRDARAG